MNMRAAIVITLANHHIHYCKALIASINYFNPLFLIIVLKDGDFDTRFLEEFENVNIVSAREVNKLHHLNLDGLLNKLNLFFLPEFGFEFDFYIHFDADSILTHTINLEMFNDNCDFYILQGGTINPSDDAAMNNMAKYAFRPADFPEYRFSTSHLYFFSASHIVLNRSMFPILIEMVRTHRYELNKVFLNDKRIKFNDQGFLNLAINLLLFEKRITVKLFDCGIYGRDNPHDNPLLNLENVISKKETNVYFIHYTASSRRVLIEDHQYADILHFFLMLFYKNRKLDYYISEFIRLIKFYYNWFIKRVKARLKLWGILHST